MPNRGAGEGLRDGQLLSAAVRRVRRDRGLSSRQVAEAMSVSLRTFQRFEAGSTRLNLDHVHRFAKATDSDPYGLLFAVLIGSPRFALNTADNHLATVFVAGVQTLEQTLGDRVSELETRSLVNGVTELMDAFAAQVLATDPAKDWLARGRQNLNARRPKPGR